MKIETYISSISSLVAILLLYSSVQHVVNPIAFFESIVVYDILTLSHARIAMVLVPSFQATTAVLLILDSSSKLPFWLLALLSASFLFVQLQALFRGLEIDCGCFGSAHENQIGFLSIGIAVVMFAFALLCLTKVNSRGTHLDSTESLASALLCANRYEE